MAQTNPPIGQSRWFYSIFFYLLFGNFLNSIDGGPEVYLSHIWLTGSGSGSGSGKGKGKGKLEKGK